MGLINFFREDFSSVIGIYFDGDKIFLARLTEKIEFAEVDFEIDAASNLSAIEQLAKKISGICTKRGWSPARIGICLREGEAITFQTGFKNVPENEIESAIKIWAIAHVGKDVRYTSMKIGDDIWMEALPAAIVEEYISAWQKFSMNLCAITAIPETDSDRQLTQFNCAVFVAEVIKFKRSPNILNEQFSVWNFTKISLTAAAIFLLILAGFSAKLGYEYFSALAQVEISRENLSAKSDLLNLKEIFDADVSKMNRLNNLLPSINHERFNALIRIGKIADDKIRLQKIRTSGDSLELEGSAENPDATKNYLSRLKSAEFKSVKLENSIASEDIIDFKIRANF